MIPHLLYQLAPIGYVLLIISAFMCGMVLSGNLRHIDNTPEEVLDDN